MLEGFVRVVVGKPKICGERRLSDTSFPLKPMRTWIWTLNMPATLRQRFLAAQREHKELLPLPAMLVPCNFFLLETLVFSYRKEVNRKKKSPLPYSICSYTQMTVTKSRQWIAGSLALVYWDLTPSKGSLYDCFNYHVSLKRITDYADFLQCLSLLPSLQLRYLKSVFLTTKWK